MKYNCVVNGVSTAAALMLMAVAPLVAQEPELSVQHVLQNFGRSGGSGLSATTAASILTQSSAFSSRVDSMATGLVNMALNSATFTAANVVSAFVLASDSALQHPYSESFDRLLEIFLSAEDPGTKAAALAALGRVGATNRALEVWYRTAAAEADPGYLAAPEQSVRLMCRFGGSPGRQLLTQLYGAGEVKDWRARATLARIVESNFTIQC